MADATGHALGGAIDRAVVGHHARRLRKIGWAHALEATRRSNGLAERSPASVRKQGRGSDRRRHLPAKRGRGAGASRVARPPHRLVLLAGARADARRRARDPAQPARRARRADRRARADLERRSAPALQAVEGRREADGRAHCRRNKIHCELDSCVRFMHCHHEKTIVIDDRVAFVGGIDLTLDGGDPYDSPEHRGARRRRLARRRRFGSRARPSRTSPSTFACAGTAPTNETLPAPGHSDPPATSTSRSSARFRRTCTRGRSREETSRCSSPTSARSARRSG